jgi:GTP-binding protein
MNKLPIVAIVGRMNVGKSTLFNRLSTSVKSITLDYAGVTRDLVKDTVSWADRSFELIDTGGISLKKREDKLLEQVRDKAIQAVQNADVVVFVVDGTVGVVTEDRDIARYLHKLAKKVILVINKSDSGQVVHHEHEFQALGFDQKLLISAQHGRGVTDLLDKILDELPLSGKPQEEADYRVMLLGRPNVGKSSLMNALVKHERSIVSDIPGTTREAVAERIAFYQEHIELVDTAGVRRKKAVESGLEELMVHSSLQTIKASDIILLLIDASQGDLVDQELKLGFYAFADNYKSIILLINKEDLATPESRTELERALDYYKHFVKKIPVLYISCKTGKNVGKVLPLIKAVMERYRQTIPEEEINRLMVSSLQRKPLMHNGEKLHVHRARQLATAPITIGLEVNQPDWFGPSQLAFFENILRAEYDLVGVPIKFVVRKQLRIIE